MTEIDSLRRITLKDLSFLFERLKQVKGRVEELIAHEPERKEELLEMVEEYLQGKIIFSNFNSRDTYTIQARVNGLLEIESVLFGWEADGEKREQRVCLVSRPSNLVSGASCLYFLCPHSHRICRKLYTDGYVLTSRHSFPHTYSERNYSHKWREFNKSMKLLLFLDDEENFKGKRERYRGRLTRYGRKVARIAGGETFEGIAQTQRSRIEKIFHTDFRRGRPPKPAHKKD